MATPTSLAAEAAGRREPAPTRTSARGLAGAGVFEEGWNGTAQTDHHPNGSKGPTLAVVEGRSARVCDCCIVTPDS